MGQYSQGVICMILQVKSFKKNHNILYITMLNIVQYYYIIESLAIPGLEWSTLVSDDERTHWSAALVCSHVFT